jgi:hypothetical protein
MCDYSLHGVASRPAKGGFSAEGEPRVAACLLPGTEVVFERDVERVVTGFQLSTGALLFSLSPECLRAHDLRD